MTAEEMKIEILVRLNAGYKLILTPSQLELAPDEIKNHKNVIVNYPVPGVK